MRTVTPASTYIVEADYPDAPVPGAKRVLWFNESIGAWEHKGWLMPQIGPQAFSRGK